MAESPERAPGAGGAPATDVLAQIGRATDQRADLRVLIVAAHPDDETVGMGARLAGASELHVAHVTDGAPRRLDDARAAGLESREAYTALRRLERAAVLAYAGVPDDRVHDFDRVDQESALGLPALARDVAELIARIGPDVVVTHPYEGGHPDHDATAFAVHAARALIGAGEDELPVLEMASYHWGRSGIRTGTFLPCADRAVVDVPLDEATRLRKAQLFALYTSQARVLAQFDCGREPLRVAPSYDFGRPPHEGRLFYEHFDWGMTAPRWCELARAAARFLDTPELVA